MANLLIPCLSRSDPRADFQLIAGRTLAGSPVLMAFRDGSSLRSWTGGPAAEMAPRALARTALDQGAEVVINPGGPDGRILNHSALNLIVSGAGLPGVNVHSREAISEWARMRSSGLKFVAAGDHKRGVPVIKGALQSAEQVGVLIGQAILLVDLGLVELLVDNLRVSGQTLDRALALWSGLGIAGGMARTLIAQAWLDVMRGDDQAAMELAAASLRLDPSQASVTRSEQIRAGVRALASHTHPPIGLRRASIA